MKRIFSLLTVAALLMTVLAVFPAAAQGATLTKTDGKYVISTKEELLLFSCLVNGIEQYEGKGEPNANAVLAADIIYNTGIIDADGNFNEAVKQIDVWIPIGASFGDVSVVYTGTFDGAGHTVSGLYSNSDEAVGVGMFGYVGVGAWIKNVNVTASYIEGPDSVGAIAGENAGMITDCSVSHGKIIGGFTENGVGGIVGRSTGYISGCNNSADAFVMDGYCGGIAGRTDGAVCNSRNSGDVISVMGSAGGIAAEAQYISKCINTGSVSGSYATGGIAGKLNGSIYDSLSYGDLFTDTEADGYYGVGALVGVFGTGTLENCYFTESYLDAVGCDKDLNPMTSRAREITESQLVSGEISAKLGSGIGQVLDGVSKPTVCSDRVYKVKITVEGVGQVTGEKELDTYVNAGTEYTAVVTDENYTFSGWYDVDRLVTDSAVYTVNENIRILSARFVVKGDADGDANLDKIFNSKDIILYKLAASGVNTGVADLTGDGIINADDVAVICALVNGAE